MTAEDAQRKLEKRLVSRDVCTRVHEDIIGRSVQGGMLTQVSHWKSAAIRLSRSPRNFKPWHTTWVWNCVCGHLKKLGHLIDDIFGADANDRFNRSNQKTAAEDSKQPAGIESMWFLIIMRPALSSSNKMDQTRLAVECIHTKLWKDTKSDRSTLFDRRLCDGRKILGQNTHGSVPVT